MSNEVEFAALAERVAKLEAYIADQVTPRFDDVQDDYRAISSRINEYQSKLETNLREAFANAQNELNKTLVDIRQKFYERVHQEIAKVTSAEIADALAHKVLVTRPATRDELKDANVLKIRLATPAELRSTMKE